MTTIRKLTKHIRVDYEILKKRKETKDIRHKNKKIHEVYLQIWKGEEANNKEDDKNKKKRENDKNKKNHKSNTYRFRGGGRNGNKVGICK